MLYKTVFRLKGLYHINIVFIVFSAYLFVYFDNHKEKKHNMKCVLFFVCYFFKLYPIFQLFFVYEVYFIFCTPEQLSSQTI